MQLMYVVLFLLKLRILEWCHIHFLIPGYKRIIKPHQSLFVV